MVMGVGETEMKLMGSHKSNDETGFLYYISKQSYNRIYITLYVYMLMFLMNRLLIL